MTTKLMIENRQSSGRIRRGFRQPVRLSIRSRFCRATKVKPAPRFQKEPLHLPKDRILQVAFKIGVFSSGKSRRYGFQDKLRRHLLDVPQLRKLLLYHYRWLARKRAAFEWPPGVEVWSAEKAARYRNRRRGGTPSGPLPPDCLRAAERIRECLHSATLLWREPRILAREAALRRIPCRRQQRFEKPERLLRDRTWSLLPQDPKTRQALRVNFPDDGRAVVEKPASLKIEELQETCLVTREWQ